MWYTVGSFYLVMALVILVFRSESNQPDASDDDDDERIESTKVAPAASLAGLCQSYKNIFDLFKLKPIQSMTVLLLTFEIAFATEPIQAYKFIEAGVSIEIITLLTIPLTLAAAIWPFFIAQRAKGTRALLFFYHTFPVE